jgi:hypothetical protein
LLPIPFLWIQQTLNRLHSPTGEIGEVRSHWTALRWISVGLGLPLVLYFAAVNDFPLVSSLLKPTRAGQRLAIEGSPAQVVLPSSNWRRVGSGYLGDDSALELIGPGTDTWLVAYVDGDSAGSIDNTVAVRRQLLAVDDTLRALEERRYFLEGADLTPVSLARYTLGSSYIDHSVILVMTAEIDETVVELIAHTSSPIQYEDEINRLLESLTTESRDAK